MSVKTIETTLFVFCIVVLVITSYLATRTWYDFLGLIVFCLTLPGLLLFNDWLIKKEEMEEMERREK